MNHFKSIDRSKSTYYQKQSRNTEIRRESIRKDIKNNQELLNVWDLAKKYMVSNSTIKSDVKFLELKISTGKK